MEKRIGVALTKEVCPICGREMEGPILMNRIASKTKAKEVEALHGQVIGYSKEPCDECKKMLEEAFIFIGYDEEKSDMEHLPEGFYRTGNIVGVKKDSSIVQDFVRKISDIGYKRGYLFMPKVSMEELGLIKANHGKSK